MGTLRHVVSNSHFRTPEISQIYEFTNQNFKGKPVYFRHKMYLFMPHQPSIIYLKDYLEAYIVDVNGKDVCKFYCK